MSPLSAFVILLWRAKKLCEIGSRIEFSTSLSVVRSVSISLILKAGNNGTIVAHKPYVLLLGPSWAYTFIPTQYHVGMFWVICSFFYLIDTGKYCLCAKCSVDCFKFKTLCTYYYIALFVAVVPDTIDSLQKSGTINGAATMTGLTLLPLLLLL